MSYFKDDVLPLYSSSLTTSGLWKELEKRAHGRLLSEVVKETPSLEQVFVGGTSPPDKYEEGSLAMVYKKLFGTSVKLREYYFLKKLDKEPRTPCSVEKTIVIDYVDHIATLLERAIARACELGLLAHSEVQSAREGSKAFIDEVLAEPAKVSEKFAEFLNRACDFTIACNEHTRFVWYLRKAHKKYIREACPELLKPEVFKFVQELLGLREFAVPRVEDEEIAELYTIYSFDHAIEARYVPSGPFVIDGIETSGFEGYFKGEMLPRTYEAYKSVGGCLCRVNELIWGLFNRCGSELGLIVEGGAPNPFREWLNITSNLPPPDRSWCELNLNSYEGLSLFDEFFPHILIGRCELIKRDGKFEVIQVRW